MARLLILYAHPGHEFSRVNDAMFRAAQAVEGITAVDLYARYPRHDIDIEAEQSQLLDHDVILFQHPILWYSVPSAVKEWLDLVLEHGFAYGADGDKLKGKTLMQAVSAAGPETAYRKDGYQRFTLREFLAPMQQTANLCQMRYAAPYVLFHALAAAEAGSYGHHVDGYSQLLGAIRDDRIDWPRALSAKTLDADTLPMLREDT